MASFDHSINHIFQVEGGYSHHPTDKGGATKYGITQTTLNVYNKFHTDEVITLRVKDLDAFRAKEVYEILFWKPLRLDEVEDQKTAHILFDQAVNQGGQLAVKRLQRAYNSVSRGKTPLVEDGIVGAKTIYALNQCPTKPRVCLEFIKACQHHYINIVKVEPPQVVFLSGWINRTHRLIDFLLFSRV